VHVLCVLDNEVYKHTPRIFNIYCLSTATTVSFMHLNVKFYEHCVYSGSLNPYLNQDSTTGCSI